MCWAGDRGLTRMGGLFLFVVTWKTGGAPDLTEQTWVSMKSISLALDLEGARSLGGWSWFCESRKVPTTQKQGLLHTGQVN